MVQQNRGRAGALAGAAFALVGVVGAAGCSSRAGASADDLHGGPDAVRQAAEVLARAGSSRTSTSMTMATGGTRVTVRGTGGFDFKRRAGRLRVVLPTDAAGAEEHPPITELLTPAAVYMKNRGANVPADQWVRVRPAALADGNLVTNGATDPMVAAELLCGAREVTYAGTEELAGTRVRHYKGTADLSVAARNASPQARPVLAAAAKGFARPVVPFDAYFDVKGRLRKVRETFSFANQGHTVGVASTTLLYDFGAPVAFALPPAGRIYAGTVQ
ncbi:hypothetical protein OG204_20545 [Streptomyces sp. NBC_01387]|uniref:hypothetical protein n=1 Tax=unclassified Streptomyces TaxID=2593676 RepID=UPI0020251DE2|nr:MULTISPECIES: hypothetical protein [unclassified Streptomyces]MCX4549296.1 hypothetical protein [Streptomyces sp. NBC_01500]WSC20840.1 hypothetical protein OIE60_14715 [Streptomyces sp. NBC_01766]WSV54867.1 hypothetical protein OG282_14760 [Streptomyces sp. NBC_01014]